MRLHFDYVLYPPCRHHVQVGDPVVCLDALGVAFLILFVWSPVFNEMRIASNWANALIMLEYQYCNL